MIRTIASAGATATVFAGLLSLAACQPTAFEGVHLGEPLTLTETTGIATILAEPDAWVGERVLIQGTVTEVCDMAGCWMDIAAEGGDGRIRVKVDDGVIVFPMEAAGHEARVEGVVEKLELTHEEAIEAARHQAEERGETFDPESVAGPETIYRLRGHGAVVAGLDATDEEATDHGQMGEQDGAPGEDGA